MTRLYRFAGVFLFVFMALVSESNAEDGSVTAAADSIVSEIVGRLPLKGEIVRVAPHLISMSESGRVLGFSSVFSEKLSSAFSRVGSQVSLHEQGDEPLVIFGSYQIVGEELKVTIRLRRMSKEASTDLAVADASIDVEDLDPELLKDDLFKAASSLIGELERETILFHDARFRVGTALPMKEGVPTLKIGLPLQEAVTEAVEDSDLFGGLVVGVVPEQMTLVPRYDIGSGTAILILELKAADGSVKARSRTEIPGKALPDEYFSLFDNRDLDVCVSVLGGGRTTIKPGSGRARQLTGYFSDIFKTRYGIVSRQCGGKSADRVIELRLKVSNKQTPDGFVLADGLLNVEIRNGGGCRSWNPLGFRPNAVFPAKP